MKKLLLILILSLKVEAVCYLQGGQYNCYSDDRLYYSGSMKQSNQKNSIDATYFPSGNVWEYLNLTGYGTYYYKSGSKFTGSFLDGKRDGYGTFDYSDGRKYSGKFRNDKRHGSGSYYSSDANLIYSGNYQDDLRYGYGDSFNDGKKQYSGNWRNGEKNGYGTEYFYGGSWYSVKGNFKDGSFDGEMEILYRASNAISKTTGIVLCCDGSSYYFDGKMYIEYKDGSSGNFFYSDNEFKKVDWIVTKEEANQLRKERESLEKAKNAKIAAERNEKERKRKQEEEIYNQCILDKVPDAKTELAAKLLEDSCKQISINPTNWQIIKYLGVDGLKQIID